MFRSISNELSEKRSRECLKEGVEGSGHESVGVHKLSFTDIQVGVDDSKRQQEKKGKRAGSCWGPEADDII